MGHEFSALLAIGGSAVSRLEREKVPRPHAIERRVKESMLFPRTAAGVAAVAALAGALLMWAGPTVPGTGVPAFASKSASAAPPTRQKPTIGINLFGLENYNRQQVFTNLIAQSEWFSSDGAGWTVMKPHQLDGNGWVRFLKHGQNAPRPLMLPPAPAATVSVRCTYQGTGQLETGGIARHRDSGAGFFAFDLPMTGSPDEGAWINLVRTDPQDPVRNIDCRDVRRPRDERFHPEFVAFLKDFRILRFLDWSAVNHNRPVAWATRSLPKSASQVGPAGASIEDMVDLANLAGADPWFLVPYSADADYIRRFAELVHSRIDPRRTVYVELGNEIWNDMFDAAQQAQREGLALQLGRGDPTRAGMIRYSDKLTAAMRIWTATFADRPGKLVRVAASQNANPELASIILGHADTARWVDALATAPYLWIDLKEYGASDVDRIFAELPRVTEEAIQAAEQNQRIAARYGKAFLAYEGGQHLVTKDIILAQKVQRDPRMESVYRHYLDLWMRRIGSPMVLYASTAPIGEYGSWGLREYAGQPLVETPKLRAVRRVQEGHP